MSDVADNKGSNLLETIGKFAGFVVLIAILLGPTPEGMPPSAKRLIAVTALMAVFWLTQAIPIAATSLIPLVAFPLMGIESAENVSKAYIDKNIFLFLGGFVIALGIEKWGLHRRIALHIVRLLGTSVRRVVLGFMTASAFLSMWISNTASTLLMLPIGLAMLTSLHDISLGASNNESDKQQANATIVKLSAILMMGIAYAASIGGFTTLVGTPTNLAFTGIWSAKFPQAPDISPGVWMISALPVGIVMLLCAWALLVARLPKLPGVETLDRGFFDERLRELGRPRRPEISMLIIFIVTAVMWILRKPLRFAGQELVPGWGAIPTNWLIEWGIDSTSADKWVHDSTVAIGMALLMFLIPAKRNENGRMQFLMDWKTAEKLPWGILLLIGGGFALAGAFSNTGLAEWLGHSFAHQVKDWPVWLLVAAICFLMTFLTEITSNVATVSAVLPILAGVAVSPEVNLDPRLIMIPATLSTSCAFMLPIATPPNAIVFGSGKIRMSQMAYYGISLNLLGVVLITLGTFLLLVPQMGISLDTMPEWATGGK